ncbi:MAG: hypothetical protein COB66_01605 [Coxiella sp. (in: Bacteria)]|nr:MAG: hypothetical protein COB66_01605 [Coxiella sp. (in: g-proteobacteria)]
MIDNDTAQLQNSQSAYLDFYQDNGISPVRQDLQDIDLHYKRRKYLYHYLGIPERYMVDRNIIEFGPGTGHNALYIMSLNPKNYTFVDGNTVSLDTCKKNIELYFPDQTKSQYVYSRIEDFVTPEKYDLVLCEGVITHQPKPELFARHIANYAETGGVTVLTTIDYVSVLAEVLRRAMCVFLVDGAASIDDKVLKLTQVFKGHLDTLPGMSRLHEDFILDNMIHPWKNRIFSIADAIDALHDQHDVLGASPKIFSDWRWYKTIGISDISINEQAVNSYSKAAINFIDYRVDDIVIDENAFHEIQRYCEAVYWEVVESTQSWSMGNYMKIRQACLHIRKLLGDSTPLTVKSLDEAIGFFQNPTMEFNLNTDYFKSWFGRGQQYLSFVRR